MFCVPNVKNTAHMNTMVQMTKNILRQGQQQTVDPAAAQQLRQMAIKEFRKRYGRTPRIDKQTKKYVAEDEAKIQQIMKELKG